MAEQIEKLTLPKLSYEEYSEELRDDFVINGDSGVWFVIPDYRWLMKQWNLDLDRCEDPITMEEVDRILDLEAKRLNAIDDKKFILRDLLTEILTIKETVDEIKDKQNETELLEIIQEHRKAKQEPKN